MPAYFDSFLGSVVESSWASTAPPIRIEAPMKLVWEQILAFDQYPAWNPFQRRVDVVESTTTGYRYAKLHVNFGAKADDKELSPVEKVWAEIDERILYVDERPQCCILAYGYEMTILPTVRMQVLEAIDENSCNYYSYDAFAGWLARFMFKPWAQDRFARLFTLSSKALKAHCEKVAKQSSSPRL
jgi:hypothetical protein